MKLRIPTNVARSFLYAYVLRKDAFAHVKLVKLKSFGNRGEQGGTFPPKALRGGKSSPPRVRTRAQVRVSGSEGVM